MLAPVFLCTALNRERPEIDKIVFSRYCLYSRWKNEAGERIPALMRVRGNALQRIKHIMKRVSKENIKPQGRLIGKLSHAAPAFLFDYMLLQVRFFCETFWCKIQAKNWAITFIILLSLFAMFSKHR